MKYLKDNIKTIAVIIGTLVGAGFASGKEIHIFFVKYGIPGLVGAIISSSLTALIIYCIILIVKTYNLQNNNEFVEKITEKKRGSAVIKNVINIFLLISFWVMCAGFCTFFKQEFNIPIICTATGVAIIVYLLLMKNIDGIIKLNTIMVPIMIIIIIFIATKNNQTINIINEGTTAKQWWLAILSSILYTSYNSITLIPIIISMKECVKDKKNLRWMSSIVFLLILALIICIIKMLIQTTINVEQIEIPILTILNTYGRTEKLLYAIVIVVAIFTSAISAGYGVLENIKGRKRYKRIALLICLLEIPISYIGFGKLVEAVYPTFGVIGILQIVLIFSFVFKQRKTLNSKIYN